MTPIYKKIFNSPVLSELNQLTKDWMILNSIDITLEEYNELNEIFNDLDYNKKDRFQIEFGNLVYNKVIITVDGKNCIKYDVCIKKPWFKKI